MRAERLESCGEQESNLPRPSAPEGLAEAVRAARRKYHLALALRHHAIADTRARQSQRDHW